MLADANHSWIIEGGVALEMRRQGPTQATRDLELIFNATTEDLIATIEESLRQPYGKFTFRRTGTPTHLHEANTWRINIAVRFNGSDWTTVSVDITPRASFGVEMEWVDAIEMRNQFGVQGPAPLPCLSLRFHIAQKLHEMTAPDSPAHRNERARDAAGVLLFLSEFELPSQLAALREASVLVFESRRRHQWPPDFAPPERWRGEFERMALYLAWQQSDFDRAMTVLGAFIKLIDGSARDADIDSVADYVSSSPVTHVGPQLSEDWQSAYVCGKVNGRHALRGQTVTVLAHLFLRRDSGERPQWDRRSSPGYPLPSGLTIPMLAHEIPRRAELPRRHLRRARRRRHRCVRPQQR